MTNQTKEKWEKSFNRYVYDAANNLADREGSIDMVGSVEFTLVTMFLKGFVSSLIRESEKEVAREIENKYADIFSWLSGFNGEFPDLSQKPHYSFRKELKERLEKLKHHYNINE